jgi:heptosyltransferase-2
MPPGAGYRTGPAVRLLSPHAIRAAGWPLNFLAGGSAAKAISLKNARAILVVRLDEIGDVILTTPFLRELRRNAPNAWITLVVKPLTANLVEHCPYVNEVLTFDLSHPSRPQAQAGTLRRHMRALRLAAGRFWKRRFDMAIIPRWGVDYYHATFLAYFSGARRRVGYSERVSSRKREINAGFDQMLTDALIDPSAKHEVEHNLEVIRFLGGDATDDRLELWLDSRDRSLAREVFTQYEIAPDDGVIALAPGAGAPRKCWPVERFVELGRLLLRGYGLPLVVVGGAQDAPLGERLETELGPSRVLNLAGRTTLRQTAALLERCRVIIGNDSAPVHLAAAVRTSVVEISWYPATAPTEHNDSLARFRPWGVPQAVLQPEKARTPCKGACESSEPHCILAVRPEQVLDVALGLARAGERATTTPASNIA